MMKTPKAESFVRGALMLSLAALVSRVLGAFYKPIIARIFAPFDGHNGAAGIGLTQVPLTAYQVILSFTAVGLNVGISRLIAERMALGDVHGAKRVFRVSLAIMTALGLLSSLAMWFGAPWIAALISDEVIETIPGFRAMAPALLITSVMAAYRGLFQGFQRMTPNASSQMIEQVVRVGSGAILTYIFVRQSVAYGAAAFNFGDVVGALAGLAYLLYVARSSGQDLWAAQAEEAATTERRRAPRSKEKPWPLVKRIFAVAGPVAISGAVVPLMMLADTFFVFRALERIGVVGGNAQAQYGMLTNAFMIVYLPTIFTSAIYTSILPAITEAVTQKRLGEARRRAIQGYRMTMLLAVPAQTGLYILATGLYALLFGDPAGGAVLAAMSWATVPVMLQQTTAGILQGTGRITLPVRNFLIGALFKIILTPFWTVQWGVSGAAYATAVGFFVAALLNVIFVERLVGRTFRTRSMLFKPVAAALAMAGAVALLRGPVSAVVVWPGLATLVLTGAGAVMYGIAILLVGGVRRAELEAMPGLGRPLAAVLGRVRFLR